MRPQTIFLMAVFVFLALLIAIALGYRQEVRLFPLMFIIPAMVLLVVEYWREVFKKRKTSLDKAEAAPKVAAAAGPKPSQRRYVAVVAWMVSFLVMIYLLGYLVSVPLFVFLYTKLHGERWLVAIALSLGALAVTHFGFVIGLERMLHEGLLFRLFW